MAQASVSFVEVDTSSAVHAVVAWLELDTAAAGTTQVTVSWVEYVSRVAGTQVTASWLEFDADAQGLGGIWPRVWRSRRRR